MRGFFQAAVGLALLIFIPLLFVSGGCGGAATSTPAQKTFIVTPHGISTLIITPTVFPVRMRNPD